MNCTDCIYYDACTSWVSLIELDELSAEYCPLFAPKPKFVRDMFEEFERCLDKRFGNWLFNYHKYLDFKKKMLGDDL